MREFGRTSIYMGRNPNCMEVTGLTERDEQVRSEQQWSTVKFLAEYDQKLKQRKAFDKTYVRQTYLIRRDLAQKFNDLCAKRPGFKTKFINFAIEKCLRELSSDEEPENTIGTPHDGSSIVPRELSRSQVEAMVEEQLNPLDLDEPLKKKIRETVFNDLFKGDSDRTTLFNKSLRGNQYQSPTEIGRGPKRFKTPEKCVQSLIRYVIKTVRNENIDEAEGARHRKPEEPMNDLSDT
jgi:hypothetical protein